MRAARLVANPGCYPTSAILPLAPLLGEGAIEPEIIVDSKSGVSGAGRAAREASLFAEVSEGIHPYGIAAHRHAPEIEQELSKAAGAPILVNFTPHLMPMNRGILSTIYVRLADGAGADASRGLRRMTASRSFRVVRRGRCRDRTCGVQPLLIGVLPTGSRGRDLVLVPKPSRARPAGGRT